VLFISPHLDDADNIHSVNNPRSVLLNVTASTGDLFLLFNTPQTTG